MPQLSDFSDFTYAELSMAAYATLSPQSPDQDPDEYRTQYTNALVAGGFSARLAADFAARYIVRAQSDPNEFVASGFSATLFEEVDPLTGQGNGKKILAIRGTNDPADIVADATIALIGSAELNPQYGALKSFYATLTGDGGPLGPNETFTVTGHSLGGFLAAAFADDGDFASQVEHAYTYNAPGFGGIAATLLADLGIISPVIDSSKVTNIYANALGSLSGGPGRPIGPKTQIFVEKGDLLNNHSVITSTDALTLYALFGQIDPSSLATQQVNPSDPSVLSIPTVTDILEAVSAPPLGSLDLDSLEKGLDAVRNVFHTDTDPSLAATPISISRGTGSPNVQNRNIYYSNLFTLSNMLNSVPAGTYHVIDLVPFSASAIDGAAQYNTPDGLAYRYALTQLNPFAITGVDYATLHDANGELDRFNVTTGVGLTDMYLGDRSEFLADKIAYNITDGATSTALPFPSIHFKDSASRYEITPADPVQDILFGGDQPDALVGQSGDDHLYGGGGEDVLLGGAGADYIEGNAGNDIIAGGLQNDTLQGGAGFDTYIYNAGDGNDTIEDSDGKGAIIVDGHLLVGGIHKAGDPDNTYTSLDGSVQYQLSGSDLYVSVDGAQIKVNENFTEGQLGIHAL